MMVEPSTSPVVPIIGREIQPVGPSYMGSLPSVLALPPTNPTIVVGIKAMVVEEEEEEGEGEEEEEWEEEGEGGGDKDKDKDEDERKLCGRNDILLVVSSDLCTILLLRPPILHYHHHNNNNSNNSNSRTKPLLCLSLRLRATSLFLAPW